MANPAQPSTFILRRSFGIPAFALSLFCALTGIATESAQAQTLNVLYSFPRSGNVGYTPYSGVIMDQAGRLYGTNSVGGEYGNGTVYRLARAGSGWIATGLYSFQGEPDGAGPMANVTFGPDGTLYGTTNAGGTGPAGGRDSLQPASPGYRLQGGDVSVDGNRAPSLHRR